MANTKSSPYGSVKFTTIDEYHDAFPQVKDKLEELRRLIRQATPGATEVISYNMPAFKGRRVLVYYAANKNHIGFYPTSMPIQVFAEELKDFRTSKGAIQFPLDQKLPAALVKKIVRFRVQDDDHGVKG